ncbi:MAG: hypothetical protein ACYSTF_03460 [Planctomycetota bacterium]|jgi:hypothetical protein
MDASVFMLANVIIDFELGRALVFGLNCQPQKETNSARRCD